MTLILDDLDMPTRQLRYYPYNSTDKLLLVGKYSYEQIVMKAFLTVNRRISETAENKQMPLPRWSSLTKVDDNSPSDIDIETEAEALALARSVETGSPIIVRDDYKEAILKLEEKKYVEIDRGINYWEYRVCI